MSQIFQIFFHKSKTTQINLKKKKQPKTSLVKFISHGKKKKNLLFLTIITKSSEGAGISLSPSW